MVETAESKFGGLDILVNNAGTSYKNKPTAEVTEDEFDRVMMVNVKSVFLSIVAVIPALKKRGGGSIVNIASIGAMRPRPGLVWYNASKGAVANVWISLIFHRLDLLTVVGDERSGRGVWEGGYPCQCSVSAFVGNRTVQHVCWGGADQREL